jgi:dTDP-4-dehydrorhamnose reductase
MTILITGASGLLGRCLINECEKNNIKYIGTYNTRPIPNGIQINFNNIDDIKTKMVQNNIKVCINCIVQRQVDICENNWEETKKVNIDMVDNLAKVCNSLNVHLIHISTDYVFDGKNAPYYPENETNPLQNYGISKLISEKRVINNTDKYTIIRVPVLYSDNIENLSENAVTIIGKKVLNQIEETSEDNYSIRRPVYIPDFCEFILSFIQNTRVGIFHYYNQFDKTTKYRTALSIGEYLQKPTNHIKPISEFSNMASRPYDTQLVDSKYDISQFNKITLDEGIKRCFKKWKHPVISLTTNNTDLFLMFDLDGTILDTEGIHYESYRKALNYYNIELTRQKFDELINFSSIDNFIKEIANDKYNEIKEVKTKYMLDETNIKFMSGVEDFLTNLISNDINFVIVTNTSYHIVNHYKKCIPLLNSVKKWICKEDYDNPKPNNECYKLAINKYYNNEKYIIGFENTINGFNAIKNEVDCVYFITTKDSVNYSKIKKEDIYLISSFKGL